MLIPTDTVVRCLVEESVDPSLLTPGDFIVTAKDGLLHKLIALGQSWHYPPEFSKWTHAALVTAKNGTMLEADAEGISYTNIADYQKKDYLYVHINASDEDRAEVLAFAKACVHQPYGYLDLFSAAVSVLTGMKYSLRNSSTFICSEFVAKALERTTFIPPVDPSNIPPAMLASIFSKP